MTKLERLRFNLQEDKFPYFSDDDLNKLLELYETVERASYEGCLIKSYDDSMSLGSILSTPNNSRYWLIMANKFKSSIKGNFRKSKTMNRADGT